MENLLEIKTSIFTDWSNVFGVKIDTLMLCDFTLNNNFIVKKHYFSEEILKRLLEVNEKYNLDPADLLYQALEVLKKRGGINE